MTASEQTKMMFEPDVVVLAADVPEVVLVAEVKAVAPEKIDWSNLEGQLKAYMLDRRCPMALIVTPSISRVYRDTYSEFSLDAVLMEGEYPTGDLLDVKEVPSTGRELEELVRDWLERLAASWAYAIPREAAVRQYVVEHVVPAVAEGRVMSGSHE